MSIEGQSPSTRRGGPPRSGQAHVLEDFEDVSELFRALSSPVRIALVTLLTEAQMCVHELVDALELPQPLVSQHLRILRDADLVTRTRRGREVAYVLRDEHVAHIVADARSHTGEGPSRRSREDEQPGEHLPSDASPHGGHDPVGHETGDPDVTGV